MADHNAQARTGRNILVCGGAGYIASHVLRTLLEAGYRPVVVDNLSTGHRRAVPDGVELVEASIGDRGALEAVFAEKNIDAVMHFCAHSLVGESVEHPGKYYRNNVGNALVLLEAMRAHGVREIVFSSSAAVYGVPAEVPIGEDAPIAPINPYGRTKAIFEQALGDYERAYGLGWAALRYFNAAGALLDGAIGEDHHPETHLIPLVLRRALQAEAGVLAGAPLRVFGRDYDTPDGTCLRDYVHVLDLASAHVLALEYLWAGEPSGAMNLGNEAGFSVLEIIAACETVADREIPFESAPRRPGDPPALVARADRARRALGWRTRHSDLATIIASAWRWHRSHPAGFGT